MTISAPGVRATLTAGVVGVALGVALITSASAASAAGSAAGTGDVYVIHGLPGVEADVVVDGAVVEAAAEATAIIGPLQLESGEHEVTLRPTSGATDELSAMVTVADATSVDVVAHSASDPTAGPVLTVFPNDLSAVAPDKARLAVAHTAAVPPADIRVDGDVLFSNVANGEVLTLLVPGATYSVDIVPTATSGPVVFGPVDVPVTSGELTRVFAFGDPEQNTMNAVVHTLPVPVEGASTPTEVQTGTGGQAAALRDLPGVAAPASAVVLLLVAAVGLATRRRARV